MHIRQWSMPAPAAPSGYCDLCDTAMLASLHEALPARLTHLLNKLSQDVLEKGFLYVREALGSSAKQTIVQELCELDIDIILLDSGMCFRNRAPASRRHIIRSLRAL